MDAPPWLLRQLAPGERVVWTQDVAPGAYWSAAGPLIGAGFALAFAGSAVIDMPGPWSWLFDMLPIPEPTGALAWGAAVLGALGFVSLVAKHAVLHSLTAWAVTDRRLVRIVRHAPFLTRSWELADLRVARVKLKKRGARVDVRIPRRRFSAEDTIEIDVRTGGARLVAAIAHERAGPTPPDVAAPA